MGSSEQKNKQKPFQFGRYMWILSLVFVLQVAILIPFRNRHEHLPILFQHLIPILQRQRLQFAFYVIEQVQSVGVCVCTAVCGEALVWGNHFRW